MKILFVSPYMPTPIRTRPFNFIRGLAQRGHAVTLATVWENAAERASIQKLTDAGIRVIAEPLKRWQSGVNVLSATFSTQPLQSRFCWQPTLARRVASLVASAHPRFDVVHVEHLRGARYALALRTASAPPIVWDSVDCISFLFEQAAHTSRNVFGRLVTRLELPRTRRYEGWLTHQFPRVLVTSEKDQDALEQLGRAHPGDAPKISVLHNGVDLDYFTPTNSPRAARTLVLTGKMSYHANATAALYLVNQVMPRVWQVLPDVRVEIVGHKPTRLVRMLQAQHPDRVVVTGSVPDLRAYLSRATIAVAPILYGAGIQNKVLEAMAMATPVVATTKAVSALSVRAGEQILIGVDAAELAQHILHLLDDPDLRERIGAQGRRYVQVNHDWKHITAELEDIYAKVMATPKFVS